MPLLVGVLVTAVWGLSFSAIKIAEETFEPLFLLVLRFGLCFFPVALFVPRPHVRLSLLVAYGLFFGVGQFGLLFLGIHLGLSPGVASVVLQLQVLFTIVLGAGLLGEKVAPGQAVGLVLGLVGVVILAVATPGTVTVVGLGLVVLAALCWGMANILVKKMPGADPLGLIVWSCPVLVAVMLPVALVVEGPGSMIESVRDTDLVAVGALLFLVYPTTVIGYSVWNALLKRHEASRVAPLTLLVPVFGLTASAVIFDERITPSVALASGLLVLGLVLNQVSARRREVVEAVRPVQPSGEFT